MIVKRWCGICRELAPEVVVIPAQSENQRLHLALILRSTTCTLMIDDANNRTWGMSATGGSAETVGMAFGKTFQAVSIVL